MLPILFAGNISLFILIIVALVFSLSFHEFGHAFAAKLFGDDTAQRMGRLTLNPLVHIDPIGLLMVVMVGFGYAKPVLTNPRNYTSLWAQLGVAAAGPLANLILAIVVYNLALYGANAGWTSLNNQNAVEFIYILVIVNLILMLFNLLPIGPLDGHYILPYFLPKKIANAYRDLNARYGNYALLGIILLAIMGVPIFEFVQKTGLAMLPYINFVT